MSVSLGCCHADDTWLLAWQSLQQQLFTLLACLEGFFPSSQRRLVSEFCELLMPLHSEHLQPVCSFSAGRSPSRQVYPKSNPSIWKLLCHRQDSLEFPLPIPPMARSQRVSCPGIAAACWTPLVLRGHYHPLMNFSETQNTTSWFWGFFTTYWKHFWLFPPPRSSYLARV